MKAATTLIAACVLIVPAQAFAQSIPERAGVNSALGIAPNIDDFVREADSSDIFAIESSKVAQERGDPKSKSFADKMTLEHTASSAELKSLTSSGKLKAEIPNVIDSSHQSKLDKLKVLQGSDFNKQYADDQISEHKTAVSLFERYAGGGDHPDLKAFAGRHLSQLRENMKLAEDLKN